MSALWHLLTRTYLPSSSHNNWLYAAAATNKKASQQNPLTHHQRSVKVSDDVSWQDKISLHQFDNYLSQVKINVTAVNNSCVFHTEDIWRVLHLSAGQCPDTLSNWGSQLSCLQLSQILTILKLFYNHTHRWICSKFSLKMPQYLKYPAAVPYDL